MKGVQGQGERGRAVELSGVHTALITPFTAEGAVDWPRARALIRRQLDAGVHGLVPCGTTGETPTLEPEEWEGLIALAVEEAAGRVPVTAGCGTNSTAGTLRNLQRAKALGADAALLVLPYYNKPNPAGHREHVRQCAAVGLPLVLYHVPGRTGQRVGSALLAELARTPGVVAVKEATGDVAYGSEVVMGTRAAVLSGDDFTWLPLLSVGGAGVISVVSNVDPWRAVALYEAWQAGDTARARALHEALYPLVRFLFADSNPVPCKAAMAALGLCTEVLRLPLVAGAAPEPSLLDGVRR